DSPVAVDALRSSEARGPRPTSSTACEPAPSPAAQARVRSGAVRFAARSQRFSRLMRAPLRSVILALIRPAFDCLARKEKPRQAGACVWFDPFGVFTRPSPRLFARIVWFTQPTWHNRTVTRTVRQSRRGSQGFKH